MVLTSSRSRSRPPSRSVYLPYKFFVLLDVETCLSVTSLPALLQEVQPQIFEGELAFCPQRETERDHDDETPNEICEGFNHVPASFYIEFMQERIVNNVIQDNRDSLSATWKLSQ